MVIRILRFLARCCLHYLDPPVIRDVPSVLMRLPYPGVLIKVEPVTNMDGDVVQAYVWRHGVDRVSHFAVSDGEYLGDVFAENYNAEEDVAPWPFNREN